MGRAYSQDLRKKMVELYESGNSMRGVSRILKLAPRTVIRLINQYQKTGSLEPLKVGRPRGSGHLYENKELIISYIETQPDITMNELSEQLKLQHGISAHPSSLSKILIKFGYRYKKKH